MSIEIKDRVALKPDWFILEEVENVGHPQGKKVYSIIPYNFVVEEGTPINKGLLQPLVDSLDVVDISNNVQIIQEEDFINESEIVVHKTGNIVSGTISLINIAGTGFLEDILLRIDPKYAPVNTVLVNAYTVPKTEESLRVNDAIIVFTDDGTIHAEWMTNSDNVTIIQFSFSYICKGENDNGDT